MLPIQHEYPHWFVITAANNSFGLPLLPPNYFFLAKLLGYWCIGAAQFTSILPLTFLLGAAPRWPFGPWLAAWGSVVDLDRALWPLYLLPFCPPCWWGRVTRFVSWLLCRRDYPSG